MSGRGLWNLYAPVLTIAFNSAKISLLVFLCRDFGEQIEDHRMFDVTSETRDDTSVIILKSRLTLHSWRENNWIHTFPKGISAM